MTTKGQYFWLSSLLLLTVKSHTHTHTLSVVGHVSGGGAELGVGLDDLVNGLQEVFLGGDLPASPDGEHARLCAHAADLSAWQETHKSNSAYRTNRKHCTTSVIHVHSLLHEKSFQVCDIHWDLNGSFVLRILSTHKEHLIIYVYMKN